MQLLEHLLREHAREDCTCNLAPLVKLSESTVSHHPRRGMSVYYRVVAEAITEMAQVLHVV
ncbi:ArsR family transcriptional regulator [Synechococcus sp. 1G10]|uniref:ArsR family transcriptional regulator n=1 Tax=Synechococcus sp. 1G10 TaxID=2025605 RepID=UPI0018EA23B9|nr:ArsR family transcriptional regulator [Synechococcus sp. 1G10]